MVMQSPEQGETPGASRVSSAVIHKSGQIVDLPGRIVAFAAQKIFDKQLAESSEHCHSLGTADNSANQPR